MSSFFQNQIETIVTLRCLALVRFVITEIFESRFAWQAFSSSRNLPNDERFVIDIGHTNHTEIFFH